MTVDPHQIHNLVGTTNDASLVSPDEMLPLLHKLSKLVAALGDCKGPECYELGGEHLGSRSDDDAQDNGRTRVHRTLESMQSTIRNRIPCHDPVNMTSDPRSIVNLRRKSFAYDLPIPEPFEFGFPFSDGDNVDEGLLAIWNEFEHYFH